MTLPIGTSGKVRLFMAGKTEILTFYSYRNEVIYGDIYKLDYSSYNRQKNPMCNHRN